MAKPIEVADPIHFEGGFRAVAVEVRSAKSSASRLRLWIDVHVQELQLEAVQVRNVWNEVCEIRKLMNKLVTGAAKVANVK
jgi:hypothetical protein